MFFNFFSTIKVKRVEEMMQSAYLCVVLHVKHKKLPFINRDFNLIRCKNQDGDHFWWRHRPPAAPPPMKYTSSCFEYQRLSTEGKIVSKYCNISKPLGRGSINLWPLPCTTLGVWICEYVRGLSKKGNVQESMWQALSILTSSCLNLLWFMTTKPSLKYAEQV